MARRKLELWNKETIKRTRDALKHNKIRHLVFRKDPVLGWYLYDHNDEMHSYQRGVGPKWITKRAFRRRQKLGLPGPRKKPVKLLMREMDFGLDEIERAMEIINGV